MYVRRYIRTTDKTYICIYLFLAPFTLPSFVSNSPLAPPFLSPYLPSLPSPPSPLTHFPRALNCSSKCLFPLMVLFSLSWSAINSWWLYSTDSQCVIKSFRRRFSAEKQVHTYVHGINQELKEACVHSLKQPQNIAPACQTLANPGDLLGKGESLVSHVSPYLCVSYCCIIARDILRNYAIIATQRQGQAHKGQGGPPHCVHNRVCYTYRVCSYMKYTYVRTYIHRHPGQMATLYIHMLGTNVHYWTMQFTNMPFVTRHVRRPFHASVEPETGCPSTHIHTVYTHKLRNVTPYTVTIDTCMPHLSGLNSHGRLGQGHRLHTYKGTYYNVEHTFGDVLAIQLALWPQVILPKAFSQEWSF